LTPPQLLPEPAARAKVDALNDRAWEGWRSDSARALAFCKEAYTLAERLNYQRGRAQSLNIRSRCQLRLANPEAALKDAAAALAQFEALGDDEGREGVLSTFGIIEVDRGHYPEALAHFLASHRLCGGRGDKREAVALSNLGVVYDHLGDYSASLDLHLRSWRITKEGNNLLGEKITLNNVGHMHYRLGQYDEALTHYFRGLSLEHVGDRQLHALLLDNIGLAYEKLGDYAQALRYQQESLDIREATGDQRGMGDSLDDLGSVYLALGESAEAKRRLERSLALKEAVGNLKGQAETCILLGTLFTREGQLEQALAYLHRARETAEGISSREVTCKAHQALAEAYKLGERFREALSHIETFYALRDSLLGEASSQKLHTLRVRFETEQAERERELLTLKNVELARALAELEATARSSGEADAQKTILMAQLEQQANEDPLTGLYNRRHFDTQLEREFVRAQRFKRPLSAVVCDLDNFKEINDRFSHLLGDRVLVTVATLFRRHLRKIDTVARYGGDEFVFLLPETTASGAAVSCEKIRHAVEFFPWHTLSPGLSVTVSLGISDDTSLNPQHLLKSADDKFYGAKHGGKNQVRR